MKRTTLLAVALATIAAFALPGLHSQDAPVQETYKGDPLCPIGHGMHPHVIYQPDPSYDEKDRKKKVQGTVIVSMIVTREGETAEIKVEKGLSPGLDEQAVKAASRWKFDPMIVDGKACPTRVKAEMKFRLY